MSMRAILALFACLIGVVRALAQGYVINSFDVHLNLQSNGHMWVDEKIGVTFEEPRHGIFRFIPIAYDNGKGLSRSLLIDSVDVTDENGDRMTKTVGTEGANLMIKIGDKDILLPTGTHKTYNIHYRCRGMMNWFEQNAGWGATAELYWNVTGDEWDTNIQSASCQVEFPQARDLKDLRAKVFVGEYGSPINQIVEHVGRTAHSDATFTDTTLSADGLKVTRTQNLPAHNGFTIVLSLPHDLIAQPTPAEAAWLIASTNLGFLMPLFVLPLMLFFWLRYGRDPNVGPLVTQFDPPDDVSGPLAGSLIDERVDSRDIAAGIFSLAVKGYLTMKPVESGMIFKHSTAELTLTEKPAGPDLSPFETKLHSRLRACGTPVTDSDLRTGVAPYLSDLKTSLYEELVNRGYYLSNPDSVRWGWIIGGGIAIVLLGFALLWMHPYHAEIPSLVGGIVSFIIVILFGRAMPIRTRDGAIAHRKVQGFAEFIRRAQGDEIEWMSQKQPDPAMFEKYLPHAIAFGLASQWAARFSGIVTQPPTWYHTPYGYGWNPYVFSRDVGSMTDSFASSAGTPPRSSGGSGGSSGFGGGGFSGGGFGGGGGGSW